MEESALYILASGEAESTRNYGYLFVCGVFGALVGSMSGKTKDVILGAIGGIGLGLIMDELFLKRREPII